MKQGCFALTTVIGVLIIGAFPTFTLYLGWSNIIAGAYGEVLLTAIPFLLANIIVFPKAVFLGWGTIAMVFCGLHKYNKTTLISLVVQYAAGKRTNTDVSGGVIRFILDYPYFGTIPASYVLKKLKDYKYVQNATNIKIKTVISETKSREITINMWWAMFCVLGNGRSTPHSPDPLAVHAVQAIEKKLPDNLLTAYNL